MFALDRSSRTVLAACAFAAFAGSFVAAPFAASSAPDVAVAGTPRAVPLATPTTFALVVPHRDPFAGEPPAPKASGTPVTSVAANGFPVMTARTGVPPPIPPLLGIPAAIQPLPPNAGAAGSVLPFAPQARVTAVVTGTHAFALIDEAGTTRVVTTGDRIGGEAIVAIGTNGVRLAHGTMLPVAPSLPAPHPAFGGNVP